MAKKRSGSGSNLGLIITLVFFVLSTIILGVTTYMGFSEQEAKDKAKADAVKEKELETQRANWYRFVSRTYRVYMGDNPLQGQDATDLAAEKSKFDQNQLSYASGQGDAAQVSAFLKKIDSQLAPGNEATAWPANTNAPSQTFLARVDSLRQDQTNLQAKLADAQNKIRQLEAEKKQISDTKDKEIAANIKAIGELRQTITAELKKDFYAQAVNDVRKQLEVEGKIMSDLRKQLITEKNDKDKATKDLAKLQRKYDADLIELRNKRRDLDEARNLLTALAEKHGEDLRTLKDSTRDVVANRKFKTWDKDWQIVTMDRKGRMPYINLGSADGLLPQVSFSIHAATGVAGRRMNEIPKGTLEVVRIIGPHLAQARVTTIRDEKNDPIMKGDFIFNATWDPTKRKQIAIAGMVDLGLDGYDNLDAFKRIMDRQKVDVVAWVDSKDDKEPSIKTTGDGISRDTEYLILGDRMRGSKHPKGKTDYATKYDAKRDELRVKAEQSGITVISLSKYLDLIGYRAKKLNTTESGN